MMGRMPSMMKIKEIRPAKVSSLNMVHVLHEGTKVEERHQNGEKGAPHAGPEVERHELQVHSDAQVIDDQGVGEEGASGTQY